MQPETIKEHQRAILAVHGAKAKHVESVPVREVFRKLVAWEGVVEIYDITGHPKAKRCYAWSYEEDGKTKTIAVLEIPPVDSAQMAVKVAIAAAAKKI
ncbi:MAG: hypothetical protein ABSE62_00530 [Chthoniobacteraceae bacterium]|jgi:hypothetical protein